MGLVSNLSITTRLILNTMGAAALALLGATLVKFGMQAYLYREPGQDSIDT